MIAIERPCGIPSEAYCSRQRTGLSPKSENASIFLPGLSVAATQRPRWWPMAVVETDGKVARINPVESRFAGSVDGRQRLAFHVLPMQHVQLQGVVQNDVVTP